MAPKIHHKTFTWCVHHPTHTCVRAKYHGRKSGLFIGASSYVIWTVYVLKQQGEKTRNKLAYMDDGKLHIYILYILWATRTKSVMRQSCCYNMHTEIYQMWAARTKCVTRGLSCYNMNTEKYQNMSYSHEARHATVVLL